MLEYSYQCRSKSHTPRIDTFLTGPVPVTSLIVSLTTRGFMFQFGVIEEEYLSHLEEDEEITAQLVKE